MQKGDGTTKNIVGRGYSKVKLLFSKYICSLIGLFVMYAIIILISILLFSVNGFGFFTKLLIVFIYSLFSVSAYTIMYSTIAFIIIIIII